MECCLVLRVQGPGSESGRDCNSEKGIVGVNDDEDPPVPIPNTVVKLVGAEDTWLETTRKNRTMPTYSLICTISSVGRVTDS